jgi:predicted transcriptional regulator
MRSKRPVQFRTDEDIVSRIDKEALAIERTRSEYIHRILEELARQTDGSMLARLESFRNRK